MAPHDKEFYASVFWHTNKHLLPSILAPACLTWCHSLILKNSMHSSFSLACNSLSSHSFYRLASPDLFGLSLDGRHCRSLMNLIPLLCTFTSSFWRCETRSGGYSDKSWSIHSDVFYFALNTSLLEGGCFWFDCYLVMSWWFHHLKTLLQSQNDQCKSSLSCLKLLSLHIITFIYVELAG